MIGLGTTIVVMNVFEAAQPALLYIVPAVLAAVLGHAAINQQFLEVKLLNSHNIRVFCLFPFNIGPMFITPSAPLPSQLTDATDKSPPRKCKKSSISISQLFALTSEHDSHMLLSLGVMWT